MRIYLKVILTAIVLFVVDLQFPAASMAQSNEPETGHVYKDWQVLCDTPALCRMAQTVVEASTRRSIVEVQLFKGDDPTLLLTFPLGVLLKTGWQYQIDDGPLQLLPFEICNIDGCHAALKLNDRLVTQLKRGYLFKIQFLDAAQTTISPAISLLGFSAAYEAFE